MFVENDVAEVGSGWSKVTTLEGKPERMRKPHVEATSAFSAQVEWEEPEITNGNITSYRSVSLNEIYNTSF